MTTDDAYRSRVLDTLLMVVGIGAAYYVTGRLGLLLALPPGYATPVWPPAGIALGALLLGGSRGWPGVLVGSWLLNLGVSFEATGGVALLKSVVFPISIGVGAVLQAVIGAVLVRHVVGFPTPLSRERDIATFLGLGGPVSCLTNATVGVTSLWLAGKIPSAAYLHHWWTWWIGDTMGVLIVTPLLLSWLAEPRDIWCRRRLSVAVPLVGALALAVVVFVQTSGQERGRLRLIFERQAENLAQTLDGHLDRYLEVLHSIARFYASSPDVNREEFRTFVHGALARHAGIRALSWNRRVPDARREAYEEAARREGFPDFQITQQDADGQMVQAARRPEYVVVSYIEPYAGNEKVLGYDVTSGPGGLEALQAACDTGQSIATGRLMLVQEAGRQFGLLVFLPIYSHGPPPATVEERRLRLLGYATGVFWIGDMIEAALQGRERKDIVLRIEDETAPAGQRPLYDSQWETGPALDDARREHPTWMHWATTVGLAGRRWVLQFAPTLAYLAAHQSIQPWTVLVGGLLFSSLLGAFLLIVTGRTVLIEHVVAERTAELFQTNAALAREIAERHQAESRFSALAQSTVEAIVCTDGDGHILTWNNGARAIFGYTADEVVGQLLAMLMPERYHEGHQRGLERMRATGESRLMGTVLEFYGLGKDGREFPLELTLSTWATAEGRFYGGIIRDITDRRRVEEALRRTAVEVARSNAEKEMLLKEIHHRVKNNLQIVSSLLHLQSRGLTDPQVQALFQESQDRVRSIARIHETLCQSNRLARIDFAPYVQDLARHLSRSYSVGTGRIQLTIQAEPVLLDIDRAIPCGLICNELITNALKHAFPGGLAAVLHLTLHALHGQVTLTVRDTGVGLPGEVDVEHTSSLGLRLVRTLTQQLRGTLTLERDGGTLWTLRFPADTAPIEEEAHGASAHPDRGR
jgi:PAS domain S-box-containing protein